MTEQSTNQRDKMFAKRERDAEMLAATLKMQR